MRHVGRVEGESSELPDGVAVIIRPEVDVRLVCVTPQGRQATINDHSSTPVAIARWLRRCPNPETLRSALPGFPGCRLRLAGGGNAPLPYRARPHQSGWVA